MRIVQAGLFSVLASAALVSSAIAQSEFSPAADPAEIYEFDVGTEDAVDDEDGKQALVALKESQSTAQEIQKTIAVKSFRFLVLDPVMAEKVSPEVSKRRDELVDLRAAVQANAIFYTAIQKENIEPEDIAGIVLADTEDGLPSEKQVTIYVIPTAN